MDQLTFLSEAPPASPTASQEKDLAWMIRAATLQLSLLPWAYEVMPSGWYSKTYRGYSAAQPMGDRPARTSPSSSHPPPDATMSRRQRAGATLASRPAGEDATESPGECLTLSISEFPKNAVDSSLSDILETGDVPLQYSLSQKACRGILNRVEKRDKDIPAPLLAALTEKCSQPE